MPLFGRLSAEDQKDLRMLVEPDLHERMRRLEYRQKSCALASRLSSTLSQKQLTIPAKPTVRDTVMSWLDVADDIMTIPIEALESSYNTSADRFEPYLVDATGVMCVTVSDAISRSMGFQYEIFMLMSVPRVMMAGGQAISEDERENWLKPRLSKPYHQLHQSVCSIPEVLNVMAVAIQSVCEFIEMRSNDLSGLRFASLIVAKALEVSSNR